jgi:hypothetical protein
MTAQRDGKRDAEAALEDIPNKERKSRVQFLSQSLLSAPGNGRERGTSMSEAKTEFLFTIALEVEVFDLGDTP